MPLMLWRFVGDSVLHCYSPFFRVSSILCSFSYARGSDVSLLPSRMLLAATSASAFAYSIVSYSVYYGTVLLLQCVCLYKSKDLGVNLHTNSMYICFRFDPYWTPNLTDADGRRYCYRQQPEIGQWNLVQLANALLAADLISKEDAEEVLEEYSKVGSTSSNFDA